MTIKTTKSLLIGAIASIGLTLGAADAMAQNFTTGTNSTYVAPANPANGGIVRMKDKNGALSGKYGSSEANRMPGTVIWMCKQTIPGGTFFTNLETDPTADKKFGSGTIDVSGDFKPGTTGPGKLDFTGSEITFSGNDPAKPQVIPPVNKDNGTGFNDVTLKGDSPKTTTDCPDKLYINKLTQSGGTFTNKADLALGAGPHTATDIVNNVAGACDGGITLAANGPLTVDKLTNTAGKIVLPDDGTINLTGPFTYTAGDMKFACNSNFNYTGTAGQTIVATPGTAAGVGFYAYGNLGVSNSAKIAGGDFKVCNNYVASSELDNAPGTSDFTMTLLNSTNGNHATFTGGVEVRGKVKYEALQAGTEYTFNNAGTKLTFETAPTTFTMDIRQAAAPTLANDIDQTKDVSRQINVAYTGDGKISSFKTMWESTDELGGFIATDASKMKIAEGYATASPRKKLIRVGATTAVNTTDRTISYGITGSADGINLLSGATAPATIDMNATRTLYSGSAILLSTKPQQVISLTNGRWSNPGTWDTGVEPTANDDVLLTKTVWVGNDQALFGGTAYAVDEDAVTNGRDAARSITIDNIAGAGLYISNQDGSMKKDANNEVNFHTAMSGSATATGIFNNNLNAGVTTDPIANPSMNGIFIASVTGSYKPVLGASQFTNNGTMVNNGIAEVGICIP